MYIYACIKLKQLSVYLLEERVYIYINIKYIYTYTHNNYNDNKKRKVALYKSYRGEENCGRTIAEYDYQIL